MYVMQHLAYTDVKKKMKDFLGNSASIPAFVQRTKNSD